MKFYDTNCLIDAADTIFNSDEIFYISSISLAELERIKRAATKDEDTKYAARHALHLLNDNPNKYKVVNYITLYDKVISEYYLPSSADSQIIASALVTQSASPNLIFVTKDLSCKILAESVGLTTECEIGKVDNYKGYIELEFNDNELNDFYIEILPKNENLFNLLENEYLLIKYNGQIEDKYKWAGDHYIKVPFYKIESKMFGKITPKDHYQQLAMDSLYNNQMTILRGPAGSGKDYLGLGYLFSLLERGAIDKIFIFVNPVATRGAAKLGYLPGDKNAKILDSQIGNFLIGKLGDIEIVYQMIDKGQLILMPISDIRGVDLSGTHAGLYMTEGQNMNIDMMKLALQRVGEDTKVIFNGDTECQVDLKEYAGKNNGLKRASEVFRGQKYYGEITLQNIYRSKIAKQADLM